MYINTVKIKEYFRLSDEQVKELVVVFSNSMEIDWQQLDQSIVDQNPENIYRTAHKMKSSFGYFLIEHFHEKFQKLELLCKEKDINKIQIFYTEIEKDKQILNEELKILILKN